MKRIFIYMICSAALLLASCTEDKGNYNYIDAKDIINISFAGLDDQYEVVLGEHLHISPEITGLIPGREYTYEWYVISKKIIETVYLKKTIANTLDLDQEINALPTAEYNLYLKITDVKTGVYVDYQTTLLVAASKLTVGWYILKEEGGKVDVDFCKVDTDLVEPNILSRLAADDYRLEGKPVEIAYQNTAYSYNKVDENGKVTIVTNSKALHIATSEDLVTFHPETLTRLATFEQQFYNPPQNWNPQFLRFTSNFGGVFLINDGDLYTINVFAPGLSRYGSPKIRGGSLFPALFLNSEDAMGFDTSTHSFVKTGSQVSGVDTFKDKTVNGQPVSTTNMGYEMVAMPINYYAKASSRCVVMKSLTDGKFYTAMIKLTYALSSSCPLETIKEVPANSKMPTASAYTSIAAVPFIFGSGNELYYYDHDAVAGSPTKEFLMKTYPAGEQIVYLDFYYSTAPRQYVTVITWNADDNTWKLYVHSSPALADISVFKPDPVAVYSGTGKPQSMVFRPS